MRSKIQRIVKDSDAYFDHFDNGVLYYRLFNIVKQEIYIFPIPAESIKNQLWAVEPAENLLTYIKKACKDKTFVPLIP